jgi:muramoyltetrapeptide carboxypeptidase
MALARERLIAMGFRVQVPENLYRARGYLAGTDAERAAELMAAFRDPDVNAIFPGTGNYGCTRMIDRLDYAEIRDNPKILIGFSDLTALHLAINKRAGLVTFHSPNPMWGLGSEGNLKPFSARYFWRALRGPARAEGIGRYDAVEDIEHGYVIEVPPGIAQPRTFAPGVARGRLTGGNLSLVAALMGTPYEIETTGRILFLEDVGERPYRVDRMLSQLRLAGKLDAAAGIILGTFRDCDPKAGETSLSLEQVFTDYFASLGIPVLMDFPAGHSANNATLPIGGWVELDADRHRVTVLEGPVR